MARTIAKHWRIYGDGYDLSGYARTLGTLLWEYDVSEDAALSDAIKGGLPGHSRCGFGPLNGFFDNDAAGLHALVSSPGTKRTILIAGGFTAAPAQGDVIFTCQPEQLGHQLEQGDVFTNANATFGMTSRTADTLAYDRPWGVLLHANGAETAVNSATGVDDNGASSSAGGFMSYQLLSSNGTVTLITEDASTNSDPSFATLASSGSLDASSTPVAGFTALSTSATVKQYLRWQLSFGTATTATFVMGFVRGR